MYVCMHACVYKYARIYVCMRVCVMHACMYASGISTMAPSGAYTPLAFSLTRIIKNVGIKGI